MRLTIEIDLDNDAFVDGDVFFEVTRILRSYATKLDDSGLFHATLEHATDALLDLNGNTVGKAEWRP
jgi:hypothetical protein